MKALPQGGSLANGNFGLGDVENESEAATSQGISEHLCLLAKCSDPTSRVYFMSTSVQRTKGKLKVNTTGSI